MTAANEVGQGHWQPRRSSLVLISSDHALQPERIGLREKSERKDKDGYLSEFRYGCFVRNVPLPPGVAGEDIKASYKDGILEVRVPVPEDKKSGSSKIPGHSFLIPSEIELTIQGTRGLRE